MVKKMALIIVLILMLMAVLPGRAQESGEARVRFANLVPESTGLQITDQENNLLVDVGVYGSLTDYIAMSSDLTGYGYSLSTGSGFSAGFRGAGSSEPLFAPDHEYLAIMIAVEDDKDLLKIDLTAQFGGLDATAANGMGRLIVGHYVSGLTAGAYTLQDANDTTLITQFFSPDFSSFDVTVPMAAWGLAPGDYQLSVAAANDPAGVLVDAQALTLSADQVTVMLVLGSYPDAVQTYLITSEGLTTFGN